MVHHIDITHLDEIRSTGNKVSGTQLIFSHILACPITKNLFGCAGQTFKHPQVRPSHMAGIPDNPDNWDASRISNLRCVI